LSARALDILIALLSRPNELVTKNDLLYQRPELMTFRSALELSGADAVS
jgi:hypothetical protein